MTNTSGTPQLPVLIVIAGLVVWTAFQSVQLYNERKAIQAAHANQEQMLANAQKMRAQLDALAAGTKRLADQGNPNAQLLVQQLAKNGISINPDAQAQPAPK